MAQYPNSANIDWTDSTVAGQGDELVDQQDVNFAEHVNEIRGEVKAIAAELGANPRGAQASVRARLENIESTKSGTDHLHDSAYIRRDALPAKGNILTATAASTPAVLAPGSNGTVVMFDSAQPTGLKAKALDHGDDLSGKGDDDHPQYLNNARHDARDHTGIPGVPPFPFVGMVVDSARPDVPSGWLECNGQAVSRTTFAALYAAIGNTYGSGDGSTTFNLPDSRGRTRVGMDSTRSDYNAVGKVGGAEQVTLTTAQMPSHSHGGSSAAAGGHNHGGTVSGNGAHNHGGNTFSSGSNHTHDAGSLTTASNGSHAHNIDTYATSESSHTHVGGTTPAGAPSNGPLQPLEMSGAIKNSINHSHSVSGATGTSGSGHTHAMPSEASHNHSVTSAADHTHTVSITSSGSGSSHENRPPFLVLKSLIFAGT